MQVQKAKTFKPWLLGCLLSLVVNPTQAASYEWSDDMCDHRGRYNHTQYSQQQIEDTLDLFEGLTQLQLDMDAIPFTPQQLQSLDKSVLNQLQDSHRQAKQRVQALQVIDDPQVVHYKQLLLGSIDEEYQLQNLVLTAYLNPEAALTAAPAVCRHYIEPLLADSTHLQQAWAAYVLQRIEQQEAIDNHDYRQYALADYQKQKHSDANSYAKLDLIGYGLNNCMVDNNSGLDAQAVSAAQQRFIEKVFGRSYQYECVD